MMNLRINGIYSASADRLSEARKLGRRLSLPVQQHRPEEPFLSLGTERLELVPGDGMGPIYVDFVGGAVGHRRRFGGGRGQPIAKAVGLKGGANPSVIDATAGLGRDAFVLASLGCSVRMIERSPIIAALLEDGLIRATRDPEIGPWIESRMTLIQGNAVDLLEKETTEEPVDVIYLDPMYPHRSKSALVKKEMRIFRRLVGDDEDAPRLLEVALGCATKRVVVKRPLPAPVVEGPKPTMAIESKQTRYDVYVIATLK